MMPRLPLSPLVLSALNAQHALTEVDETLQTEYTETQVYVGLNDADTRKQEQDTEYYVSILKRVCVDHGVAFSFDIAGGGYIHDDGEYTEEQSIVLTFINVEQETVDSIARDLCSLFNQESVLITSGLVKTRSIRRDGSDETQD